MSKRAKIFLAAVGGVVVYFGLSYGLTLLGDMGPGNMDQDAYARAAGRAKCPDDGSAA